MNMYAAVTTVRVVITEVGDRFSCRHLCLRTPSLPLPERAQVPSTPCCLLWRSWCCAQQVEMAHTPLPTDVRKKSKSLEDTEIKVVMRAPKSEIRVLSLTHRTLLTFS